MIKFDSATSCQKDGVRFTVDDLVTTLNINANR